MCGIAGIINFNDHDVLDKDIRLMMSKMKHRGPDDEGVYLDQSVGLGFVRLSILDLSPAGHQPMFSDDASLVMIFNGEVFNYVEIKNELKDKYTFHTGTDTEVILKAYQEWGEDCLDKLNGMFAFVIYNTRTKEVFAARDRFGIKPFYYYQDEHRFIFASEIKSILPLLEQKEANDPIILDYLLYNRTDHTSQTFFKGIFKMQHGSCLQIKEKQVEFKSWYVLKDKIREQKALSPAQYRALFDDSLKLRLRADVPVGVSLSGGIDSSSIVTTLINDFNLKELITFSAVYGKDEPTDESEYIDEFKSMVKHMFYTSPGADDFYNDFDTFIEAHNEPVPDIGPYAQFKVMELAAKHVTVTLDGQGADEQLAGYHYFFGSYYKELLKKLKLGRFFIENIEYFKKHKSTTALKYMLYYLLPDKMQSSLNSHKFPSINKAFIQQHAGTNEINKMLYAPKDLTDSLVQHFEYKLEHLLRWEDLNSMHFSIESRVPFLDYRLVEATIATPSTSKIYKGETKHILREALKDILPEKITQRKDKKGFTNPRAKWFKTEQFKQFIDTMLASDSFASRPYFDAEVAKSQYQKHLNGDGDYSKEIWKWINLEIWLRKFIDN